MNFIGYRTFKTGVGAVIAMILAEKLGLQYSVSAGIITILSIQSTKVESVKIALQRVAASILALSIASILFKIIGYNPITFGIFLLIFIPLTVNFNLEQGIIVSSVLVTHLLVKKEVSTILVANEFALMLIGVMVALLLNLYMPSSENKIKKDQKYIEENMKKILFKMSSALKENYSSITEEELFESLGERIYASKKRAYNNLNNYLIVDMSYYVEYMEMRRQQFKTIKRMKEHFQRFFITYEQTIMVADFTEKVAKSFDVENTAEELLEGLEELRKEFKKMSLPLTREEFENRAMLYQFLNDLEQFLLIKYEFRKTIINKN